MPQQDDETRAIDPSTAADAPKPAPELLKGRYELGRELGRGGFGVVYLAKDTQLMSKQVVVKVLTTEAAADSWANKKFHQEMEALARIDHPAVINALDTGQTADGQPFLVMQFVEGPSLRAELKERPDGLALPRAASIIRQTGQALGAAHDKGILHKDIKPENILLQKTSGGEEYVKLIDFGVASIADSAFEGGATKVAGTYTYMAPEQLRGKPSPQTDVYALALVAYEVVTGMKAYQQKSVGDLVMQQQKGPETPPRQLRPDLPPAAEQVILRNLSFDPAQRAVGPREFGEDFSRAMTSQRPDPADAPTQTMMAPQAPPPSAGGAGRLEVAHVLFLDIVGYSTLAMDQQTQYLSELQKIVRETPSFRDAEQSGNLIRLPTGDGMALTFFGDPVVPVQCAVELARQLRLRPHLHLRTGVHSGPVYRVADINANMNVAGGGINMAQRVMDCGDSGHILVSSTVADILKQLSAWRDHLQDLGEVTVKHGVSVRVYNLVTADAGNAELPKKIKPPMPVKAEPPRRTALVAGIAILLLGGAAGGWYWLNRESAPPPPPAAERKLTYSITLQKTIRGQPQGRPAQLPGELIFTPEHYIALNITSADAGHLYLINHGPITEGVDSYNILFPVLGGASAVTAGQGVRHPAGDGWIIFDAQQGTEKLYLVWSARPVEQLEQAAQNKVGKVMNGIVVIDDPSQMQPITALLAKLSESAEATKDVDRKETTIKKRGDGLAYLIRLEHH
jgi:serine/threonine protein kinase